MSSWFLTNLKERFSEKRLTFSTNYSRTDGQIKELGMVYTPIIPALGRLRQENLEFKVSLGYCDGQL
jgi:hypothetical protein